MAAAPDLRLEDAVVVGRRNVFRELAAAQNRPASDRHPSGGPGPACLARHPLGGLPRAGLNSVTSETWVGPPSAPAGTWGFVSVPDISEEAIEPPDPNSGKAPPPAPGAVSAAPPAVAGGDPPTALALGIPAGVILIERTGQRPVHALDVLSLGQRWIVLGAGLEFRFGDGGRLGLG